jgi:hypothetical protein
LSRRISGSLTSFEVVNGTAREDQAATDGARPRGTA